MTDAKLAPGPGHDEVRGRIKPDRRVRRVGAGLASLAGTFGFWLGTLALIAALPWWAALPIGLVNGLAISMLFVVGHDAAHGSLFPRRWMNRLAGRLGLLPALHPYSSWVHSHNRLHHAFTNIKGKDSSFPPLSLAEYRALPGWHRWLTRRYRTWYGLGLYYFADVWLKWEVFPTWDHAPKNPRAFRLDRLLVLAFSAVWVGGLVAAAEWTGTSAVGLVVAGFVVPQMTWNYLIGFIIFQQHTHPRVPWYSARDLPAPSFFQMQIQATPHLHFPAPFCWLMRHIMEHSAHHADPLVPLYELAEAQRDLERAYRRQMVRPIWTRRMFLHTLRTCRLYDFDAHRWLDYDGTPTTEPLLPAAPPRAEPAAASVPPLTV
jgi:omega-6 fatty acid desaturase (delta-12 desaturase)